MCKPQANKSYSANSARGLTDFAFVFDYSHGLLRHVAQDQPRVFVRERRSNPHMTQNRCHHPWRKLFRSEMATPAVSLESFFAFNALRGVIMDWRASGIGGEKR